MQRITARPFFDPNDEALRYLPEGPRILRDGSIGWVAIDHGNGRSGSVNLLDPGTGQNRSIAVPGRPGFFAETEEDSVVVVGMERRLVLLHLGTGEVTETGISVSDDERTIINDGIAVRGGLLFGSKHLEFKEKIASLFHFDAESGEVRQVLGGQTCSNGKFFHTEGSRAVLIDIDSQPKAITRYEIDTASWRVGQQSLVLPPGRLPGYPDGLRPTASGESVVVAFYNPDPAPGGLAWEIRLSDGAVLTEWELPGSPRVTCPEFFETGGGVKLLFTTAVEGMPEADRPKTPHAGSLFLADTPFEEAPPRPPLVPTGALRSGRRR